MGPLRRAWVGVVAVCVGVVLAYVLLAPAVSTTPPLSPSPQPPPARLPSHGPPTSTTSHPSNPHVSRDNTDPATSHHSHQPQEANNEDEQDEEEEEEEEDEESASFAAPLSAATPHTTVATDTAQDRQRRAKLLLSKTTLYSAPNLSKEPSSSRGRVQVVLNACGGLYYASLLACMESIVRRTQREVEFHALLPEGELHGFVPTLRAFAEARRVVCHVLRFDAGYLRRFHWQWHTGHADPKFKSAYNLVRLYLPLLLPEVDRVVFLDADTLVFSDIGQLSDALDLPQHNASFFAAVSTFHSLSNILMESDQEVKRAAPLMHSRDHFNAAVWVTNLNAWRDMNLVDQFEHWLRLNQQKPRWQMGTQGIMNLVLYDKWTELSKEWNHHKRDLNPNQVQTLGNYRRIKLIHFYSLRKTLERWVLAIEQGKPLPLLGQVFCDNYPFREDIWFCDPVFKANHTLAASHSTHLPPWFNFDSCDATAEHLT